MNFPKTPGQCEYLRVVQSPKPIIIATGPAGSGKTMFGCQVCLLYTSPSPRDPE